MSMHPPSPERTSPSGLGQQRHGGFGPPEFRTQHSGFGTNALSRDRLGVGSLVFFTVSASAPMTVLAGGVVATFAVSGVIGVPLAFPILAVILALFAVGYGAMSRHVVNAGVFYAYISKGLGGAWGVAASFVALISYNAIQIGLYGLFGAATGGFIDAKTGLNWSWWAWGFIAMAVVAILGLLKVDLNARLLAVLLIAEVIAVVLFDVGALAHPAGGSITFSGFNPSNLFKAGATGVVFAFSVAAFTGFESAGDYSEEAKNPRRTVAIALAATVAITGVLYTVSAWALGVGYGADKVVSTAQDPNGGMPFGLMASNYNNTIADIANVLLLTSVFAALLSFHNTVGRYLFAAGRERVLPRIFAHTSARTKAPIVGSITQTILAIIFVTIFAAQGKDPIAALFTWFSYISAVGILLLMFGTSIACIVYLNKRRDEGVWRATIAPGLATIALGVIMYIVTTNADAMLGTEKESILKYVFPGLVIAAALVGLIWGAFLKSANEPVYAGIGNGGPAEEEFASA
jgi:amino acid transporter